MRMFRWAVLPFALISLAAIAALGAGAEQKSQEQEKKGPAAGSVGGIEAKDGATITGVVRFKGAKPETKPISDISGNAFCKQCYRKDKLPSDQEFIFGKNGNDDTLQNVLVYVSKGLEGKKFDPPRDAVVLDQV